MSLPDILKYVYNHASDEVIRRGKKIFSGGGVHIMEHEPLTEYITFRVRNDNYNNHYKVTVQKYLHPQQLNMRCQCPYNMGSVCRHEAAALFQLNELIQSGFFNNAGITYDQQHTTVRMRQISEYYVRLFSSQEIASQADTWATGGKVSITEAKDDTVKAVVTDEHTQQYEVTLFQNEDRYFDTSCTCLETHYPLCIHKAAAFLFVLYKHGAHYFSTLRNWDTQKNKLLSLYGYSLDDDIRGKFEFAYHEGKPFLRVLDKTIKKLSSQTIIQAEPKLEKAPVPQDTRKLNIGVLVRRQAETFPNVTFDLIGGELNEDKTAFAGKIEKLDLFQLIPTSSLSDRERILVTALRKQSEQEFIKSLKRNLPFGEFMDNIQEQLQDNRITAEMQQHAWDFYLPRYRQLLQQYADFPIVYYLPEGKSYVTDHIEQCHFSNIQFKAAIHTYPDKDTIALQLFIKADGQEMPLKEFSRMNDALLMHANILYAAADTDTVNIMNKFPPSGIVRVGQDKWNDYLENELLPLAAVTEIIFDDSLQQVADESEPELRLYLKETEKMLSFKPVFSYDGMEKEWLDFSPVMNAQDGKVFIRPRNEAAENTFLNLLRYLHPNMQESRRSRSFLLSSQEALKGGWYFTFIEKLQEAHVKIFGFEMLKQMRINPHRPKTQLHFGSGIDWFDAEVKVSFGDQQAGIDTIKKALSRKENFVQLSDGSVGLLPEDWMEKYGLMTKLGVMKDGKLHFKKFHFSAVEHLADEIDDNGFLTELVEKRQRLMDYDFGNDKEKRAPQNVAAEMRPYQVAGYQWMHFLKDTSWGGILADDMGLGKTLQTLAILQEYKNEHTRVKFLVACPTTLMYNWENEIKKFTPGLSYHIYHGPTRKITDGVFQNADIIITTYGTLRSDIKSLSQITFDYVVLDESQAIKNPLSQVAKAVLLLQAKNKLALSGTPVQNNTFDLYSQMNFLNPGMLGSADFFRNEFATPIDKMQDDAAQKELRKLIYPFLLRRTKEQVAPDLPEKTETVLYCEMGAKQRKIYDAYRNSFRSRILDEIEHKGMERSQLSILTGLMKLRQVCDSPAILNEEERFENHSVKIDELVRELTENTGKHKALVFSQFLGMLALIRQELERLQIPYVYFDGSTSTSEREKAIQRFQQDNDCRVFLISLKAGGVGLNLTAADYVYIVDPWWNPAVEQQAIDRTHRIGQTKNIFAYRLICKDTIEEKIMLLQQRKLNLVKGLITDDSAFLKKLTKEDIAYLLS